MIGLAAGALILGGMSYIENKKANKSQAKALEEQRKQQLLTNRAQRRAEARKALRERANIRSTAAASGSSNSSSFIGGLNTAATSGNMRTSFLDTMSFLDTRKFNFQKAAMRHQGTAQTYSAASSIVGSASGMAS